MVAIKRSTITKRFTFTCEICYRALLQIRREEVNYTESRTFSKKSLAEQTWGENVDISGLDKAMAGLQDARIITKSEQHKRYCLRTGGEEVAHRQHVFTIIMQH